jgi:hypothetical protein
MARGTPNNKLLRAALSKFLKPTKRANRGNRVSSKPGPATRNPNPAENVGPNYQMPNRTTARPYRGGSYQDMLVPNPAKPGKKMVPPGTQLNHIPPCQVMKKISGWDPKQGGAVQMDKIDHRKVHTTGGSGNTKDHRKHQQELIENGQMRDAIALDILDIRARFGNKYDEGINEMIDKCYPDYADLKNLQPDWKSQG